MLKMMTIFQATSTARIQTEIGFVISLILHIKWIPTIYHAKDLRSSQTYIIEKVDELKILSEFFNIFVH